MASDSTSAGGSAERTPFPTVEAFYADDERRRRSPELDYGVWWRHRGLVYRLTWVEATGELIAVQLTPPRVVPFSDAGAALLGVAVIGGDAGAVTVLGVVHGRETVERVLDGWAHVEGDDQLDWVLARVRT